MNTQQKRFKVALSYPGDRRTFVEQVAGCLSQQVGRDRVLYDKYYEAEFARPDLDTYLQRLYHDESEMIAVFLCADYERKEWCGLEWRALRDLIKLRHTSAIMPLRFDNTEIPGLFSTDGYVWIDDRKPEEIANLIVQRWQHNVGQTTVMPTSAVNDLILRTRLASLTESLGLLQYERGKSLVQEAWSEVSNLHALLSGRETSIESGLKSLWDKIRNSKEILGRDGNSGQALQTVLSNLEDAERMAEDILEEQVAEAQRIAKSMHTRAVNIREDRLIKGALSAIDNRAGDYSRHLVNIDTAKVQRGLIKKAWGELLKVWAKSKPLFEEYVDFLGGVALRDTGFDERVCQMADELIIKVERLYGVRPAWLTVPAHHEAVRNTLARSIIRLGYPEWTIWALPLVAHEFGHLLVQHGDLPDFRAKDEGEFEYHCKVYLADSFATYMMGPAYACAAILLRFDPSTADKDTGEQSATCARVVFSMLERFNAQDPSKPYSTCIETLKGAWEAALDKSVGEQPAAAKRAHVVFSMLEKMNDQDQSKPYSTCIETLKGAWEAALEQNGQSGSLDETCKDLVDGCVWYVEDRLNDELQLLTPPKMAITQEWPRQLLENEGKDIEVNGTEELREVLNAAWLARLQQPSSTEKISRAAIDLWDRIQDKRIT